MPGTTSLTLGNEALSHYLFDQVKEARAMKDHPYLVVEDCMSNFDRATGGERVIVRWVTDDHSVQTRVVHGYESFNTWAQPIMTPGYQGWGIVVQPVFISEVDETKSGGGHAILPILKERVDQVERQFHRSFQTLLLRGAAASGTHPGVAGWDDFLSLNGADNGTGIIEDQTDGTNTIHGVTKASFPLATHEQFHNTYRDCQTDASANLLNAMYGTLVHQELKSGAINKGNYRWYVSQNTAEFLKQILRPQEQYVSDGNMDDGARVVQSYGGIKMRPTVELPSTGSGSTANPWSAALVDWKEGVRFRAMNKWAMDWTPFTNLSGSVGTRYALLRLWGNLIALQNGKNGLIVDGETF